MVDSKRSAADTFGKRSRASAEDTDDDIRPAYQRARERSDERLMLKLIFATGRSVSLSYAYLTQVEFNPGDVLGIRFGRVVVTVSGRRLERIAEDLLEHRVRHIQEGTEAEEGLKPADAAHVDEIKIEGDEV